MTVFYSIIAGLTTFFQSISFPYFNDIIRVLIALCILIIQLIPFISYALLLKSFRLKLLIIIPLITIYIIFTAISIGLFEYLLIGDSDRSCDFLCLSLILSMLSLPLLLGTYLVRYRSKILDKQVIFPLFLSLFLALLNLNLFYTRCWSLPPLAACMIYFYTKTQNKLLRTILDFLILVTLLGSSIFFNACIAGFYY